MGYSAIWKILEEIVVEFRKKGIAVSEKIMTDLRSAKTLIKLLDTVDKNRGETAIEIEQLLESVEGYLITEAQNSFPSQRIDEWLQRLNQAGCDACCPAESEEQARFVSGVPREKKWVRVKPIDSLPSEKLKELATDAGLSYKADRDDYLIVYGKEEEIKDFLKKMTEQTVKKQRI